MYAHMLLHTKIVVQLNLSNLVTYRAQFSDLTKKVAVLKRLLCL